MDPVQRVSVTENGLASSIIVSWTEPTYNGALAVLGYYL